MNVTVTQAQQAIDDLWKAAEGLDLIRNRFLDQRAEDNGFLQQQIVNIKRHLVRVENVLRQAQEEEG